MKAIVCERYGPPDVLQLKETEKPSPKKDEALIRVYATTVTPSDCLMRKGEPFWGRIILGFRKPRKKYRILGTELAGEVEAIGENVERFKVNDQVFGFTAFGSAAYAEYKCMPEKGSLVVKPTNMTYEQAAALVDGGTTALFFLKDKAHIQNGNKVLVIGASGSIGTYAVQLAKYFGATVTGVCTTSNLELVKSLEADKVIDYTQEDFTKNGQTYDIIFDTVNKSSFADCYQSLTQRGIYLGTDMSLVLLLQMLWTSMIGNLPGRRMGKRALFGLSIEKTEALNFLKELIETGKIKPVIDRHYHLEQIAEAHRYVEKGHKKGNVVITV